MMLSIQIIVLCGVISHAISFTLPQSISEDQQWALVQRRDDGSEAYWNRTWNEYKNGFGSEEEGSFYWMGLERLHGIASKSKSLKIEMWGDRAPGSKNTDDYYWAIYTFSLDDETTNYTAHFDYDWQNPQGNATTGWYDLTCNTGVPFSTIDRINDPAPLCVTDYHLGGWWLRNCALASLNGEYNPSLGLGNGYGLFWIVDGLYLINPSKTKMWISL